MNGTKKDKNRKKKSWLGKNLEWVCDCFRCTGDLESYRKEKKGCRKKHKKHYKNGLILRLMIKTYT